MVKSWMSQSPRESCNRATKSFAFSGSARIESISPVERSNGEVPDVAKHAGRTRKTRVAPSGHGVGALLGSVVGPDVGLLVGRMDGFFVGEDVGREVGEVVGR